LFTQTRRYGLGMIVLFNVDLYAVYHDTPSNSDRSPVISAYIDIVERGSTWLNHGDKSNNNSSSRYNRIISDAAFLGCAPHYAAEPPPALPLTPHSPSLFSFASDDSAAAAAGSAVEGDEGERRAYYYFQLMTLVEYLCVIGLVTGMAVIITKALTLMCQHVLLMCGQTQQQQTYLSAVHEQEEESSMAGDSGSSHYYQKA
jgi:hypothetical protein